MLTCSVELLGPLIASRSFYAISISSVPGDQRKSPKLNPCDSMRASILLRTLVRACSH